MLSTNKHFGVYAMTRKIGRNELCSCGSGLKYKKCCLNTSNENFTQLEAMTRKQVGQNDITIIHNPKNQEKISVLILEMIDQYNLKTHTFEQTKSLVCLACIAWNLALETDQDTRREETIKAAKEAANASDEQTTNDFISLMHHLVSKKLLDYPDNKRYIVDFNVTPQYNGEVNIQIASTFPSR